MSKTTTRQECQRCSSEVISGYCADETCPFSDHAQDCPVGWHGHGERDNDWPCKCIPPWPEDECPNCKNGTVGLESGRIVCRGECSTDFGTVAEVTFRPQAWQNDYAVNVDTEGPTVFYVPATLVEDMPTSSYESDTLREHPNCPQWAKDWAGPFECDFDVLD